LALVGAINTLCEGFLVIVVTCSGEKFIEALAYVNGAAACLCKPVSPMQLADAMKQCRLSQDQPAILA
jgi:BarA-like signal transduction histidine kinase